MKKWFSKPILILIALMLTFSSMGFSHSSSQDTGDTSRLATIHGDYDFKSDTVATVIVELEEPSIIEAKHTGQSQSRGDLAKSRQQVMDRIAESAPSSSFDREYDYLFSGFSVEVKQSELRDLASVEGVQAIHENVSYQAETIETVEIGGDEVSANMIDSAPFIGANDAWENLGVTGEGVTVAVIDTGVDYTHPDLSHAFGDYKGWDFVDQDDDPQETQPGDVDNADDLTNHGSHVAGTIAANGAIKGVAPDANLLAYRVLGPGGSGATVDIIAAIEQAVQDGADVMNLSLGNTSNDPDYVTSIALDNAMAEGVIAVSSNGNSGPYEWTVGSPGTSRDAISVGATELPYMTYDVEIATESGYNFSSASLMGHSGETDLMALNDEEFEFEFVGLGSADEFDEVDVEGKIALIERGEYPFVDKAANAQAAGAVGAIIFNNVEGEQPEIAGMAVPTIKMSQADGQQLLQEYEEGDNTVSIDIEEAGMMGETVADFSSRGPVLDTWMVKPDVSAPGVNIISTVPTHNPAQPHAYASMQGTSMSAPHVAGSAALLVQEHPDWDPQEVKGALMNTAEKLTDENGDVYPHNTQGAGSVRIVDALTTETLMAPGSYSFGTFEKDNGKQVERQHFEIQNLSDKDKKYDIDFEFFDGEEHIKVNSSDNLNVKAGGTKQVNLNVQVDSSKLEPGYYESMITLTHEDEVIEIPSILFVQNPYEVVPGLDGLYESGSFTLEDGIFDVSVNLKVDVDYVESMIYTSNLSPVGTIDVQENLPAGENNFEIDANSALDQLPPGTYALVIWVGKAGFSEEGWILGEFEVEEDEDEEETD
ncbi:S8 family serine peptidase [Alkalibacillus aidingensis]|uniref:S8 family serine peptidase n=1 Tax=Alkalibacillus aidingensis TaxID=2747607 RepID=UPI002948B90C|nr:S8 family serine peptidase [Alkalibacillus aidingensis]